MSSYVAYRLCLQQQYSTNLWIVDAKTDTIVTCCSATSAQGPVLIYDIAFMFTAVGEMDNCVDNRPEH